jgi:tetratricopeptide (TPR) repeat protein
MAKQSVALLILGSALMLTAACKKESVNQNTAASPNATQTPNANQAQAQNLELPGLRKQFEEEVKQNPSDPNNHYNLANVYAAEGKHVEAIEEYKKVLAANPKDADSLTRMALALSKLNRVDEAFKALDQAAKLDPKNAAVQYELGNLLLYKQGKADKAAAAYQRVVQLDPKNVDAYFNLGNAYNRLGQNDKQIDAFKKVVELNSRDADGWFNLGNACFKANKLDDAISAYSKAVELKGDDIEARKSLFYAYLKAGNKDKAAEQYDTLKSMRPELGAPLLQRLQEEQPTKTAVSR